MSNAEIGRRIGMVASAVFQRIRRLEDRGLVLRYDCVLNAKELGFGLIVFITVQASDGLGDPDTGESLAALPNVLEVHRILGEPGFIVKARVRDTDALAVLLEEGIGGIPNVGVTRTSLVLTTLKETTWLPVALGDGESSRTD